MDNFIAWFPLPLTQKEAQVRQVKKFIQQVCTPAGSCIDVGTYKGFFLNLMIHAAPQATHIAFEPIPKNYNQLLRKYSSATRIYKTALTDEKGNAAFYHTLENSSFSGLKKLTYPIKFHLEKLEVETDILDNIIQDIVPTLIKITVQGAELRVLKGAAQTLHQHKPLLLLMPDIGDMDIFHTSPEALFDFLSKSFQYNIFTLKNYLAEGKPLLRQEFSNLMDSEKKFWYVVAAQPARIKANTKHR